ncbi:hypothetical protein OAE04_00685, partial [bacterium]|nr:hypothetical protein [bacterium]
MKRNIVNYLKPICFLLIGYLIINYVAFSIFYNGFFSNFISIENYFPAKLNWIGENLKANPFLNSFIFLGALKNLIFSCFTYLFIHPFLWNWKIFRWKNFKYHNWIKGLGLFVGFLLTWELITYEYNFYFNQGFYFDRILLLVFLVGIYFHPLFVPLFLINALLFRSQFNFPIGGFPLFDKRVLFDLILLVYSFLLLSKYLKIKTVHFFLLVFSLIAGNYFSAFQAKCLNSAYGLKWLTENGLEWFFLNAKTRGWLSSMSNQLTENITLFFIKFAFPLKIIILLTEASSIIILFRKNATKVILASLIFMHLAIFTFGSMLFWKWIGIDLFLLYFIYKAPDSLLDELFSKKNTIISVVIIFCGLFIFRNFAIGWHDTPLNQTYTYEVICEDGNRYHFPKNEFNPYHQLFQYDHFNYLNSNKLLKVSGFGYTANYKLAKFIRKANWKAIKDKELSKGKLFYGLKKKQDFQRFLQTFFLKYNQRISISFIPLKFSAPHHLYNTPEN